MPANASNLFPLPPEGELSAISRNNNSSTIKEEFKETMAVLKEDEDNTFVEEERAGLLIATAAKETASSDTGVELMDFHDKVIVSHIASDSIFAGTPLKYGVKIVNINRMPVTGMTAAEATDLLHAAAEGKLTMIAERTGLVSATVTKETQESKVGVILKHYKGRILFRSVSDSGIFTGTDIRAGQILVSVNGTDVSGLNKFQAIELFRNATSTLAVIAQEIGFGGSIKQDLSPRGSLDEKINMSKRVSFSSLGLFNETEGHLTAIAERTNLVVASAVKETKRSEVGISLMDYNGMVLFRRVDEDGIFAGSGIESGLKLNSVNKTDTSGMTKREAIELFKKAEGKVTVVAERIGLAERVGIVVASVDKETQSTELGISLLDYKGKIIFNRVSDDSIFAGTGIKVGLRLVSVNKTDVSGMKKNEAIKLFKNAVGKVTVVAERIGLAEKIGLVVATAFKENADCKVGVALLERKGFIYLSRVSENGIFAGSGLEAGLRLISVNKIDVSGMSKDEAIELFREAEGEIAVVAQHRSVVRESVTREGSDPNLVSNIYSIGTDFEDAQRMVSVI